MPQTKPANRPSVSVFRMHSRLIGPTAVAIERPIMSPRKRSPSNSISLPQEKAIAAHLHGLYVHPGDAATLPQLQQLAHPFLELVLCRDDALETAEGRVS